MNSRSIKILVDIFMTIFLVLSFIRWEDDPTFHYIVGSVCTLFFIIHVCIHRKWLKVVTKSCLSGKLKKSLKWKYIVNILLLIIRGIAIITGFLAIGYFSGGMENMAVFSRLHAVTSRIGLVPVVIHVVQHWAQIKSYFNGKKITKSKED